MRSKLFRITFSVMVMCAFLSGCGSSDGQDMTNGSSQNNTAPIVVESEPAIETEITSSPEPTPNIDVTLVEQAYNDMINPSEYLSITNDGYKFKDYPISSDSVSEIGGELVVNQGAMYEEIGAALSLYCEYGLSQVLDEDFFRILTGSSNEPENWDKLSQELYAFILPDGTEKDIISELETLDCVVGTFDYDTRSYEFEITDLSKAVDTLEISEEMFGYMLAKLNEYTDQIVFDGNSVTCTLRVQTYGQ